MLKIEEESSGTEPELEKGKDQGRTEGRPV